MDTLDETWLTADIRHKLAAIRPPHVPKKRVTVIKLAYARANEEPVKAVFNQPDTCHETIWYTKWQHIAEVKAAFDACYERLGSAPPGYGRWSLKLLANQLVALEIVESICPETVRQTLKTTK